MLDELSRELNRAMDSAPAEQLRNCVATALRRCGFPPLQFLDVDVRDGHVYLSARVPTLFLTEHPPAQHASSADVPDQALTLSRSA